MERLDSNLSSPEVADFRRKVTAFLSENLPSDIRAQVDQEKMDLSKEDQRRWHKTVRAHGLACPSWPKEYGGAGLSDAELYILEREFALAGAPRPMIYGVTMLGPALIAHGTADQKRRFLPGILEGDTFWCQGFSETNAGSDLASLKCTARRDGDCYVINGHKMWTSEGHIADWMFGIFRTDSSGRKQQGITFLLLDMRSPGVSVQPIATFDGTGTEINQVFFDDVRVPIEQRIGDEGAGWEIAKSVLTSERFGNAEVSRSIASLARLEAYCKTTTVDGKRLIEDPFVARRLIELEIALRAVEQTELRFLFHAGEELGAEAALLKLRGTEVQNAILSAAADFRGPAASLAMDESDLPPSAPKDYVDASHALKAHMNYRKTMIYGGSSEVQRNILAKGVLGL
ncbi:acyl-CoA dehydrogenase family protein [Ensifer adhaerens]|uniref:acyl-CoA dehydrogenase family protein n=1 Tax=Ensifer adhaerens TaxID=106592 RepID=UPI001C4E1B4B|nr:acyl-CoA dehydrogenase family protein [Ensifer adhaerens]MBW0370821.1 acyl-CoA dehydrogenase family protein [Ensifer adhaerens]UCM24279.1 acyl-CoA dehydrogenase family protein [Ensifer adhaerens]